MTGVSVIIPNYNGKELLQRNLPYLLNALKEYAGESEVIIVDDASVDDSVKFISADYPQVKLVVLEKNNGFAAAVNAGVRIARQKIIYLLNSDVRVEEDFLSKIVSSFDSPEVFSVTSRDIISNSNLPYVRIKFGMFLHYYMKPPDSSIRQKLLFSSGGHSAFDLEKFLSLGGFDELFSPFYWEDIDICWRAWKKGWVCLWEPESLVRHEGGKTINNLKVDPKADAVYWKHHFLFIWKNFSPGMLLRHFLLLPLGILAVSRVRKNCLWGFLTALGKLKEVSSARRLIRLHADYRLSDKEVLAKLAGISASRDKKAYITLKHAQWFVVLWLVFVLVNYFYSIFGLFFSKNASVMLGLVAKIGSFLGGKQ